MRLDYKSVCANTGAPLLYSYTLIGRQNDETVKRLFKNLNLEKVRSFASGGIQIQGVKSVTSQDIFSKTRPIC